MDSASLQRGDDAARGGRCGRPRRAGGPGGRAGGAGARQAHRALRRLCGGAAPGRACRGRWAAGPAGWWTRARWALFWWGACMVVKHLRVRCQACMGAREAGSGLTIRGAEQGSCAVMLGRRACWACSGTRRQGGTHALDAAHPQSCSCFERQGAALRQPCICAATHLSPMGRAPSRAAVARAGRGRPADRPGAHQRGIRRVRD